MKKTIIYLLIISTLIQSLSVVAVLACFKINQGYIIQMLCENKDMPEMGCQGHCQLKKQLEQKAQSDKLHIKIKEVNLFVDTVSAVLLESQSKKQREFIIILSFGQVSDYRTEITHPPCS